jgi:hypothetical protein
MKMRVVSGAFVVLSVSMTACGLTGDGEATQRLRVLLTEKEQEVALAASQSGTSAELSERISTVGGIYAAGRGDWSLFISAKGVAEVSLGDPDEVSVGACLRIRGNGLEALTIEQIDCPASVLNQGETGADREVELIDETRKLDFEPVTAKDPCDAPIAESNRDRCGG